MAGTVYTVAPIPPDPAHTNYLDAGVVSFGVEYRLLDNADLEANYEGADREEIQAALAGAVVEDQGVSIHVIATESRHEYLRFDCFAKDPHYHYIEPSSEKQTIVAYDSVAMGDMLEWTLGQLETRLAAMLEHAGGAEVAEQLEAERIAAGLALLREMVQKAQQQIREQRP